VSKKKQGDVARERNEERKKKGKERMGL